MSRLTVLHVFSGDLWAGAEVMVYHLLNSLNNNMDIRVVAISLNEGTLTKKLKSSGIETYIIPEKQYSFPTIIVKVLNILKGIKVDVIHSHRYKENILAFLLGNLAGRKRLVATLHGMQEPLFVMANGSPPIGLTSKLNYFLMRCCFSKVVAVSNEMKEVLIAQHNFKKDKVDVIYNGIPVSSVDTLPKHSKNSQLHIGSVGRLVPVKNYELYLDIASEILKKVKNVRFSILGEGPLSEKLSHKISELGLEDRVELQSPRPDPLSYYLSLDLYLNTSLHEGIPLSILEAMLFGKAVIASDVGGITEIIKNGETGFLVSDHNITEFVNYCVKLIENSELRDSIAKKGQKRVICNFSDVKMANSYMQLYNKIV